MKRTQPRGTKQAWRCKPRKHRSYRQSATIDEVPPIFGDVYTTIAVAALAAIGPMNVKMLKVTVPGSSRLVLRGLKRLERLGVIVSFDVPLLKGTPRVYALNKGHKSHTTLQSLGRAIWRSSAQKRARCAPRSPFWVPARVPIKAHRGEIIWRASFIGKTLHVLAEFRQELQMSALIEFLKPGSPHTISMRMDRLIAFGLVQERYDAFYRWLSLNPRHPIYKPLRAWLLALNQRQFPEFRKFERDYRRLKEERYYDRSRRLVAAALRRKRAAIET